MIKSILIAFVWLAVSSVSVYAGGGKGGSFGKWDYDKFGEGSTQLSEAEVQKIGASTDPCRQYVHVKTKFHVRVKNYTQFVQIGRNGYAEMTATLGSATKSCDIPYNIEGMRIRGTDKVDRAVNNSSYLKANLQGVGLMEECFVAVYFAWTKEKVIMGKGYLPKSSGVRDPAIMRAKKGCDIKFSDDSLIEFKF